MRTSISSVSPHPAAPAAPGMSGEPVIAADADRAGQSLRHKAVVRVTHWIIAASVLGLLVSGVGILISHPRLYWGETGAVVNFESGVFTAQLFDNKALFLNAAGATGGPNALARLLPGFFIGVNDPLGFNPKGTPFTSKIFDLYQPWTGICGSGELATYRKSVGHGEDLFNNTPISITGVGGLNDTLTQPTIAGFCGTCHDTPDVGDHSVKAPLNIGIANAGNGSPPESQSQ
jgi:hypothetical protein